MFTDVSKNFLSPSSRYICKPILTGNGYGRREGENRARSSERIHQSEENSEQTMKMEVKFSPKH